MMDKAIYHLNPMMYVSANVVITRNLHVTSTSASVQSSWFSPLMQLLMLILHAAWSQHCSIMKTIQGTFDLQGSS